MYHLLVNAKPCQACALARAHAASAAMPCTCGLCFFPCLLGSATEMFESRKAINKPRVGLTCTRPGDCWPLRVALFLISEQSNSFLAYEERDEPLIKVLLIISLVSLDRVSVFSYCKQRCDFYLLSLTLQNVQAVTYTTVSHRWPQNHIPDSF